MRSRLIFRRSNAIGTEAGDSAREIKVVAWIMCNLLSGAATTAMVVARRTGMNQCEAAEQSCDGFERRHKAILIRI